MEIIMPLVLVLLGAILGVLLVSGTYGRRKKRELKEYVKKEIE